MYENVTYAELKKLPAAEKPGAWKELKNLYKTQKQLAEKLGVGSALVYNMISKYVKDEPAKKEILKVVPEPKKTRTRVKKQDKQKQQVHEPILMQEQQGQQIRENIVIETNSAASEVMKESFSISIKKAVSGEDAQFFLNGVGSTLLKNQKYMIEVKITEE